MCTSRVSDEGGGGSVYVCRACVIQQLMCMTEYVSRVSDERESVHLKCLMRDGERVCMFGVSGSICLECLMRKRERG